MEVVEHSRQASTDITSNPPTPMKHMTFSSQSGSDSSPMPSNARQIPHFSSPENVVWSGRILPANSPGSDPSTDEEE